MGRWRIMAAAGFCLLLGACAPAAPATTVPLPSASSTARTTARPTATDLPTAPTAAATEPTVSVTAPATTAAPLPTAPPPPATSATSTAAPPTSTAAPPTSAPTSAPTVPTPSLPTGDLLAVTPFDMGFLAVGTGGTAALLDSEGTLTLLTTPVSATLRGAAACNGVALIGGDGGTLLTFDGETFVPVAGAQEDLLCVTRFGDLWYIGGRGAALYAFDGISLTRRPLPLLGDLTGLAANGERLMGVTSLGEWFTLLPDGTRQIGTVNGDRQGDERIGFVFVAEANGLFWATGRTAAGEAAVLTTLFGGVWSPRSLTVVEGQPFDPAGLELYGITAQGEQAVAAANGGRLLVLPDCPSCNKWISLGEGDFLAVCRGGDKIAAVGRDLAAAVADDDTVHQYTIAFDTAQTYLAEGAVLIDVRGPEEHAARHIAGSVNIPLPALAEELAARYPDRGTALIFYCAKGMRSADAAKTAAALGYARAYTVGGIDEGDWEYE